MQFTNRLKPTNEINNINLYFRIIQNDLAQNAMYTLALSHTHWPTHCKWPPTRISTIMLLYLNIAMRHTNGSGNIDKVKIIENEIRLNGWPAADLPFSIDWITMRQWCKLKILNAGSVWERTEQRTTELSGRDRETEMRWVPRMWTHSHTHTSAHRHRHTMVY